MTGKLVVNIDAIKNVVNSCIIKTQYTQMVSFTVGAISIWPVRKV